MSNTIDNLIAFRVLYLLVTPFEKTEAYKLGVIDKDGNVLVKVKDQTPEQKDSYSVLNRLVFSLKRLLGKLPGGKSQIATLAAAYYLIKESHESGIPLNEQRVRNILTLVNEGITLVEEEIIVEEFLAVFEDGAAGGVGGGGAIANVTGATVSTDYPAIRKKRKYGAFEVPDNVFRRFAKGKKMFAKWSEYLDLQDEEQGKIYQFAKKNPKGILVLKAGEQVKAIRYNRNGGGAWNKLQRKPKLQQVQEMYVEVL